MLTRMYYGALTKKLEQLDIDRHFSVLILLDQSTKPCSQKDISELLMKDKASMVRIIDYLSDKHYITRVTNPEDRRHQIITLTEKAKRLLPKIYSGVKQLNDIALKGLKRNEKKYFYSCIDTIFHNLQQQPKNKIVIKFKTTKRKLSNVF